MNTNLKHSFWAFTALFATAALVPAQDTKSGDAAKEASKAPAVADLIEQLGDRNYQTRKSAEAALRSRGQEAIEGLRKAASDHSDSEVKWRARRLVEQIESGEARTLQRRGGQQGEPMVPTPPRWRTFGQGDRDLEEMFGDIFEHLERDFGVDIPRTRFFHDDFFKGLQQQMDEARRGMAMGMPGRGQAFSMRMDQNGVRIEVTERGEDGKSGTKVYEAPDVQSFRKQYPEVAERYLRGDGVRTFSFGDRVFPGLRAFGDVPFRIEAAPPMQDAAVVDNGERLGVIVEDVPEPVRDFLGLEPGAGLRVQSVNGGSLAEALGVEAGDIVLQVGDKAVRSTQDVREGLAGVDVGGVVNVKVNRRGVEKALEAKKPESKKPESGARKLEKRTGDSKGEIR